MSDSLKYLSADELEGRGIGTAGLEKAGEYIAQSFSNLGLNTRTFQGSPFQRFSVVASTERGPENQNRLALKGPADVKASLALGKDFNSLAIGGSAEFDAPLVFAGYGITAKDLGYDDYEGLNVADKIVVILRKEPEQNNPHSRFDGTKPSPHSEFRRKVANAYEHGALGIILVNDDFGLRQKASTDERAWNDSIDRLVTLRDELRSKSPEEAVKQRAEIGNVAEMIQKLGKQLDEDVDQILDFRGAGLESSHRKMPVLFCRRTVIDPIIKAGIGKDLATLEKEIDAGPAPHSQELDGWRAQGESNINVKTAEVRNVVGVLEGQGPLASETVIVGAHYDHVGMGGPGSGSLAPWTQAIHNGADDNGSGTAALLELAHYFATRQEKPRRRMVFIAFTGEERGLLGSEHYVKEPPFPLESTVAMVNLDMVGRLSDDKLIVYGTGTAAEFDPMIERLNGKYGFKITKHETGLGPSDQATFYQKKIPVFHFFTGTHSDYHRPSDDFEKINIPGMRKVTEMVREVTEQIVAADKAPAFQQVAEKVVDRPVGDRPYFGSIPDMSFQGDGYKLNGVAGSGPAERAGIKGGDIVVKFGESKIGGLEDLDSALRKYKAGDKVPVVVKRGADTVTLTVTLDPPR